MASFEERLKRYNERHGESSTSPAKSGTSFEDRLARYNERNGIETNPVSSATPETPQPKVNLEPNQYTTRVGYTDTGSRNYSREDILRMLADAKVAQEQERALKAKEAEEDAFRRGFGDAMLQGAGLPTTAAGSSPDMNVVKKGNIEAYTDAGTRKTSREDRLRGQGVRDIVRENEAQPERTAYRYENMPSSQLRAEWQEKNDDAAIINELLGGNGQIVPLWVNESNFDSVFKPGNYNTEQIENARDIISKRKYIANKYNAQIVDDGEKYRDALNRVLDRIGGGNIAYRDANGNAVTYANLFYENENKEKATAVRKDKKYAPIYAEAEQLDKDIAFLDSVTNAPADAYQYNEGLADIEKRYGVTLRNNPTAATNSNLLADRNALDELWLRLNDKRDEDAAKLKEGGYDYGRMSEYTRRLADRERLAEDRARYEKMAEEHPVLATLANLFSGFGQLVEGIDALVSGKGSATPGGADSYVPMNTARSNTKAFSESVNSTVSKKIEEDILDLTGSDTLAWLVSRGYSGVTSVATSLVTMGTTAAMFGPAGEAIGLSLLGSGAGMNAMVDAAERGANNADAIFYGLAAGINEALFEKLSFDRFVKIKGSWNRNEIAKSIANWLWQSAKQGGVEASEEVFTDIANRIADNIINDKTSEYETDVARYKKQGLTTSEAQERAKLDFLEQVVESAYGGFIGGGASAATKSFTNIIRERAQELRNIAPAKRAAKGNDIAKKIASGKELTTEEAKLVIADPKTSFAVQETTGIDFSGLAIKNGVYTNAYTPEQVKSILTDWYDNAVEGRTTRVESPAQPMPRISLNNSIEQNLTALAQTPTAAETSEISAISPAENTSEGNFTSAGINARNAEITSDKQGSWNKIADSFGENGRKAMRAAYDGSLNEGELGDLAAAFAKYYEVGRNESSLLDVPARISATVVDAFGDPNEASAFIQSAVQAGAADRALTISAESDTIESQEIEGGTTYDGQESGVRVRGGSIRGDVQSTRGQTHEVRGEQAQNQGGRTGDVGRGTSGEIGQNVRSVQERAVGEKVSPKQLGIRSGSDASNVVMKAGDYAIREAAKLGIDVTAVKGALRMKDGVVDGVSYRDSRTGRRGIVYQGDSKLWTEKQFIRHEGMHIRIAQGKVSMNAISDAIKRLDKTDADVRTLFDAYLAKYGDIYDDSVILEEIFCDAYAAMDRFGVEGARKAMDTIRREFGKTYEASRSAESESVTESYERYSINSNTYEYAKNVTGVSKQTEVAYNAIRELGAIQKEIGKNIRQDLPQGHWRMNIHNMNEYLAKHTDVWQRLVDIQKTANENGVPVDFVTPVGEPYVIEGKTVEGGLKGFPIEYVTKEDGGYKFNGFARSLSQLFVDRMNDAARWQMQDEFIAAVEDAYNKRESMADPVPELDKMLKTIAKEFNVPGKRIASKTKFSVQTALRSAKKTVMALNLNAACPMFTVGNHGCYLDACYLTQMGAGGNTVNLFQSSIYAGEILQLSQATIDMLNADPDGLRINGVGDTIRGNKGALLKVFEHAAMRGLKLKIITKQIATLDILREAAEKGIDISDITVQLSMDNLWIPAMLDDAWGSGIRGTVGIAQTVKKGNLEAASVAYDAIYGREAKTKDGVLYRKYGFSAEKVNELIKDYPEINILPRYVVTTASEIADLALGNGPLGQGPFIQTLMHGVVPEPCYSDYPGKVLNFGSLRHVVEKNANGEWEFYGARVAKDKQTGAVTVTRVNSSAHAEVDAYIKNNYTPAEQNTIYRNLQKQLCCKASEKLDACAGCQSLYAGGCSLCAAMKAKRNQNYAIPEDLVDVAPATSVQAKEGGARFSREEDAEYLRLAEDPEANKAELQRMVDEAAKEAGFDTPRLYHGTDAFGYTQFNPNITFLTDNLTTAEGYGNNKGYAYNRRISDQYIEDDGTTKTLIKNAKNVFGKNYREITDKDVADVKARFKQYSDALAAKVNDAWVFDNGFPKDEITQRLDNGIAWVLSLPGTVSENLDEIINGEYSVDDDIKYFDEYINEVKEWFSAHRKEIIASGHEDLYKLVTGFELSDFAIDVKYDLARVARRDEYLANEYGSFTNKNRLRGDIESAKNLGSYSLFANLGNDPLVIDGNGAFWANLRIPEELADRAGIEESKRGENHTTTTTSIAELARKAGYTAVVFKNIYDPSMNDFATNVKSDVYAVFNPREQLKSADPVTYDDNGNVIPLSERFNSENDDIRYSRLTDEMAEIRRRMAEMTDGFKLTERELLTNALETVSDERELAYLESYRNKINRINAWEAEAKQLRRDMMSGNLDAAEYKKAQVKANHLEALVRDADSNIIKRVNASKPIQNLLKREQKKAFKEGREAQKLKEKEREAEKILRDRIKKIAKDFNERLQRPTERRWVPRDLIEEAAAVAEMIDPTGAREGTKVKAKHESMKAALLSLKEAYGNLAKSPDPDFKSEFRAEFSSMVGELATIIGNTPVRDMSFEQLEDVYAILNDIRSMLSSATKQIGTDNAADNYDLGTKLMAEQAEIGSLGLTTGKVNSVFRNVFTNPMRAVYEMSGHKADSVLNKQMKALEDGWVKAEEFRMTEQKKIDALRADKNDLKKFNDAVEKPYDFGLTTVDGKPLKISKMQAMQILLTYERETSNANRRHLENHIEIPDPEKLAKGKVREALDKPQIMPALTAFDVNKIVEGMDEWDKRFLNVAREVFRVDAANAINEVTVQTRHRPVATEKAYIPYELDENLITKENENVTYNAALDNAGILKSMTPNANQPLIIRGLNYLLQRHIDDVAKIYGLSIPIRNFNKVLNVKEIGGARSVRSALSDNWGARGTNLIDQAIADVQASRKVNDVVEAMLGSVKGAMVVGSLVGNLRVWLRQAASYPTAASVISHRALTKGIAKYAAKIKDGIHAKDVWDEIDKITPLHYMRRSGLSDQELGEFMQSKGWKNRVNSKLGKMSPMKWIQAMDVGTTAALFYACKEELKSRGVTESDENYKTEMRKLYNQVLTETQPMYDPLHRVEMSKGPISSKFFVFQTQPMQNSGILREGALEFRSARKRYGKGSKEAKAAGRKFARAATSQFVSHLVFTAMGFIANAMLHRVNPYRDDDEGKVTPESIFSALGLDLAKNYFNAVLPFVGNVASQAIDNFINGTNYALISDATVDKIVSTGEAILNAFSKPSWDSVKKLGLDLSTYFGVPGNNLKNLYEAVKYHTQDIINGEFGSFEAGYERTSKQTYNRLYNAWKGGSDKYKSYYDDAIESGKSEQQIKQAMDDRIKQDKGVDSVTDLKPSDRYLSPSQQKTYDAVTRRVKSSEVWAESDAANRAKLSEIAYDVIAGNKRNTWKTESITTENDLTQTEYILYKLALDIVDKPDKNGKYGSETHQYTDTEKELAVKKAKQG